MIIKIINKLTYNEVIIRKLKKKLKILFLKLYLVYL
jgi:hypothetical protein